MIESLLARIEIARLLRIDAEYIVISAPLYDDLVVELMKSGEFPRGGRSPVLYGLPVVVVPFGALDLVMEDGRTLEHRITLANCEALRRSSRDLLYAAFPEWRDGEDEHAPVPEHLFARDLPAVAIPERLLAGLWSSHTSIMGVDAATAAAARKLGAP